MRAALFVTVLLALLLFAGWLAAHRGQAGGGAVPGRSPHPAAPARSQPRAPPPPAPASSPAPAPNVVVVAGRFFDTHAMEVIGDVPQGGRDMALPLDDHPGLFRFRWREDLVADTRTRTAGPPPDDVVLASLRVARAGPQQLELGGLHLSVEDSIVARDPGGAIRWRIAAEGSGPLLQAAPDGVGLGVLDDDLFVYSYHAMSDTGVAIARIRPADGTIVWRAIVEPLGVRHSKYWHLPYIVTPGDRLIVVSQGSAGNIVEKRDPATGALLERVRF